MLERGLALSRTWNIPVWFPLIASALGFAYALSGRVGEALALLERAVAQATTAGIKVTLSLQLAFLGEANLLAGRIRDASEVTESALELSRRHKERGHEAWALRLLGEIASHHDSPHIQKAEDYYHQAMALADELGMRPLQAHCHLSLGRLYGGSASRGRPGST